MQKHFWLRLLILSWLTCRVSLWFAVSMPAGRYSLCLSDGSDISSPKQRALLTLTPRQFLYRYPSRAQTRDPVFLLHPAMNCTIRRETLRLGNCPEQESTFTDVEFGTFALSVHRIVVPGKFSGKERAKRICYTLVGLVRDGPNAHFPSRVCWSKSSLSTMAVKGQCSGIG